MIAMFGATMIVIGWLSLLSALRNRRKAEQARSWRTTEATIVKNEVVVSGTGEERSTSPRVEYTYRVAGKELSGNTISFATAYTEADARAWIDRYPVGRTVPLRYNPDNARESCLEAGADRRTSIFVIGSAALIVFGFYLITSRIAME